MGGAEEALEVARNERGDEDDADGGKGQEPDGHGEEGEHRGPRRRAPGY